MGPREKEIVRAVAEFGERQKQGLQSDRVMAGLLGLIAIELAAGNDVLIETTEVDEPPERPTPTFKRPPMSAEEFATLPMAPAALSERIEALDRQHKSRPISRAQRPTLDDRVPEAIPFGDCVTDGDGLRRKTADLKGARLVPPLPDPLNIDGPTVRAPKFLDREAESENERRLLLIDRLIENHRARGFTTGREILSDIQRAVRGNLNELKAMERDA